jgi:NAD(P)-dependent dehydrogenase (short-subunit alcohol dehydrogenase family)
MNTIDYNRYLLNLIKWFMNNKMIQVTHSPLVNFGPYCIAKEGLEMMSRLLSVELGPHKIRVNTVRPGQVYTDMLVNAKAAHG